MSLHDFIGIMVLQYESTIIDDNTTSKSYKKFVKKFAKENNVKICGDAYDTYGTEWTTSGFTFNSEEDELIFRLKYSVNR